MKTPQVSVDDFSFKIGLIIVLLVLTASGISYLETITLLVLSIWAIGMLIILGLVRIHNRPRKQEQKTKTGPTPRSKPKRPKPEPPTTMELRVDAKGDKKSS